MTAMRFPPRHWTVDLVERAVADLGRGCTLVRFDVLSLVEPWMVLAVPDVGVRVFVPGESKPRLFGIGELYRFDELILTRWLPDARAWLLREAGYSPAFELEPPPPMDADDLHRGRAASGLTQADLARLVGVGRTVLQRWEAGERAIPPERATRIREILGPMAARGTA